MSGLDGGEALWLVFKAAGSSIISLGGGKREREREREREGEHGDRSNGFPL